MSEDEKRSVDWSAWEAGARDATRLYHASIKFDELVELLRDYHPRCVVPKSKWVQ